MKPKNKLGKDALKAIQRASERVRREAREKNLKIPIWRDGKIVHEVPQS